MKETWTTIKRNSPSNWIARLLSRPVLTEQICTMCGYTGAPIRKKKGHDEIEMLLWIAFIACAILYVVSYAAHHLSHYHFPGVFARTFKFFAQLFLTFGIVYTIWQISTEFEACPKCQHPGMIPPDSPRGNLKN